MKNNSLVSVLGAISSQFMGGMSEFAKPFSGLWRTQPPSNQSFRHGSSKSKGGRVDKKGESWSFVERSENGMGVFKLRQTGEKRLLWIKPVGGGKGRGFSNHAIKHFGLDPEQYSENC